MFLTASSSPTAVPCRFWSKFSRVNDVHQNELPRISEEEADPKGMNPKGAVTQDAPNPKV